jgi:hypothetical protein
VKNNVKLLNHINTTSYFKKRKPKPTKWSKEIEKETAAQSHNDFLNRVNTVRALF